jgi:signal transduction histidine kinase
MIAIVGRQDDLPGARARGVWPGHPAGLRLQADVIAARGGYRRCVSIQGQAPSAGRPRRPPLTKRMRPGHWMALDFLAAVACVPVFFLGVLKTVFPNAGLGLGLGVSWPAVTVSALLAVALAAPVALRRRGPLAALVASMTLAVAITVAASAARGGVPPNVLMQTPTFLLPAAYVIHLVAAQYRRRTAVAALAAVLILLLIPAVTLVVGPGNSPAAALFTALVVIILWMVGYTTGQRRAYAEQLQEQVASGAVAEERLRIARELHDVVAHSMTVVAVQAGYGLHVIDGQPAQAKEALGAIQATSREALAEMRRMLGVLRRSDRSPFNIKTESGGGQRPEMRVNGASPATADPRARAAGGEAGPGGGTTGGAAPLAPAPGLADLERLAARMANAGVRVDLQVRGERREVPPGIDLAAFRIVQEALTNVVKHADVPQCRVVVGYGADALTVEITDEGRGGQVPAAAGAPWATPGGDGGGGHGLIGMRERVSLYGGELTAAPLPERGFRVTATLPTGGDAP